MSLDDFQVSPKAIEGFRIREYARLERQRLKVAQAMGQSHKSALLRLAGNPRGLVRKRSTFGLPDESQGSRRVGIHTARRMYRAGLVRFVSNLDGTWLELTPMGRQRATILAGRRP